MSRAGNDTDSARAAIWRVTVASRSWYHSPQVVSLACIDWSNFTASWATMCLKPRGNLIVSVFSAKCICCIVRSTSLLTQPPNLPSLWWDGYCAPTSCTCADSRALLVWLQEEGGYPLRQRSIYPDAFHGRSWYIAWSQVSWAAPRSAGFMVVAGVISRPDMRAQIAPLGADHRVQRAVQTRTGRTQCSSRGKFPSTFRQTAGIRLPSTACLEAT